MENEVVTFINNRFKNEKWLDGNCLWFALILRWRFPGGKIYYLPIIGHFIYKYKKHFYDWSGEYFPDEKPVSLSSIKRNDPSWYNRLLEDCLL